MSSYANDLEERRRVSKVTFSPISSDVLCVKIRKVSTEVRIEDIPEMSSTFQSISKIPDSKREDINHSRYTMTDIQVTASTSSQTARSEKADQKKDTEHGSTPCLRHAAENIGRKAADIPSEKINMCNNCSKSMLSYIFLVQDFLDSLAKEISGSDNSRCLQCARQEVRDSVAATSAKDGGQPSTEKVSRDNSESKQKSVSEDRPASKRTSRAKGHRQEPRRHEGYHKSVVNPSPQEQTNQQRQQVDFIYSVSSPGQDNKAQNLPNLGNEKRIIIEQPNPEIKPSSEQQNVGRSQNFNQQWTASDNQNNNQQWTASDNQNNQQWAASDNQNNQQWAASDNQNNNQQWSASDDQNNQQWNMAGNQNANQNTSDNEVRNETKWETSHSDSSGTSQQTAGQSIFRAPMERMQPNYDKPIPVQPDNHYQNDPNSISVQSPTLFSDDIDGIISTLSNVEREIYDSARNTAGWEGMTEPLERFGLPADNLVASEAFVTSCRNNAEAIGCLVVGTSLLLCRTTRMLCVLVSEGVSSAFRGALSSVFQVVQYVRSLDSLGTTKLALLEQPELGVTFEKLNIWRLVQFTKCVYLNPDTLVVQNCDELFGREELSAVPDIGWPDCFNSGVFVFSPNLRTFWQLMEFAEKQGSYDGGDQGLLNSYFPSWSSDITKKLSFIYNLMANVSYTYTPAFRQFGRDVKIVQFHGSFKPWHVKFFTSSGQISPSSPVHPTYVQFVHIWLSIFRISVLRLMSKEIQSYAASQETICAVETLRFFPLPSESEAEFFLTPPSVRLRLAEKKLMKSTSLPISEARRRKSAEFPRYNKREDSVPEADTTSSRAEVMETAKKIVETVVAEATKSKDVSTTSEEVQEKLETSISDTDEVFKDGKTSEKEKVKDENALPGAEVGNYLGMKAWEQGRMDYQGADSSDNVMKRLEFLMSKPS